MKAGNNKERNIIELGCLSGNKFIQRLVSGDMLVQCTCQEKVLYKDGILKCDKCGKILDRIEYTKTPDELLIDGVANGNEIEINAGDIDLKLNVRILIDMPKSDLFLPVYHLILSNMTEE